MRKSYAAVLAVLIGVMAGCDMMKSFMPGPTANKAVSVPGNAGLVVFASPDSISFPARSPGAYYFVDDETSKIIVVTNEPEFASATPIPEAIRTQLDEKRKYRVYYVSNKNSTQPATIPT